MLRSSFISLAVLALAGCGGSPTTNPFLSANPTRVPTITLQNPANLGEAVDDTYTFNVAFGSVVLGDTWTLYYLSEATDTKGGAIVQNIAVSNHTIAWRTTTLPSGTYYFWGELKSFYGTVSSTAPGSIVIDHPNEAGNHSPTVALTSHSGGYVDSGADETVTWTGSDADGDAVTYALQISDDAGNTWTSLATGLTAKTYSWSVTQPVGLAYKIRVVATDAKGSTASDQSGAVFAIR